MTVTEKPTYEEQVILNWYRARKAYAEDPTDESSRKLDEAEEALVQIGMDLNEGSRK